MSKSQEVIWVRRGAGWFFRTAAVFAAVAMFCLAFALGYFRRGVVEGLESKVEVLAWAYVVIAPLLVMDALRKSSRAALSESDGVLRVNGFRNERTFRRKSGLELNFILLNRWFAVVRFEDSSGKPVVLTISRGQLLLGDLVGLQSELSKWYRGEQVGGAGS